MADKLQEILNSILRRDNKGSSETLVVASHVQQMTQWIIRQGVRFFPKQDIDGEEPRKMKLDEVLENNRIDLYLPGIVAQFLCSGSILWYLRPSGSSQYEIHWYRGGDLKDENTEYAAYYKPGGRELDKVIIRYSYEDFSIGRFTQWNSFNDYRKWVRLIVEESTITKETYLSQPPLTPDGFPVVGVTPYQGGGMIDREVTTNSLGFIPCAVSPNHPMRPGDRGSGEFNWLQNAIEAEDAMRAAMVDNVFTFSSPSLVTTRPAQQITEALEGDGDGQGRPTWSQQQGYGSVRGSSSRGEDPWVRGTRYGQGYGSRRRRRVASIIGNVLPEERFGYIFPDPINGDQWRFATEYREGIHECLGGIDPLGSKSGMTFGEVKSLHGKVASTANQKCKALWTYGLAKILEMVIRVEEELFVSSYREYMVTLHPQSKKFKTILSQGGVITDIQIIDDFVNVSMQAFPPGVFGLAPYGDRKVNWKWEGPVFEKTSQDKLQDSIVVRNEQELGVGSLEAMQALFPDKDPRELKAMLTGVPFRFIQSVSQSIGTLLDLQGQMSSIPDPIDPSLPLAARMDLTGLIEKQIQVLQREVSYSPEFDPLKAEQPNYQTSGITNNDSKSSGIGSPTSGLSSNDSLSSSTGFSQQRSQLSASNTGTSPNPAGSNPPGGAVRPDGSDWQRPIPSPGGSVLRPTSDFSPASATTLYPGVSELQSGASGTFTTSSGTDLWTNPGLFAQLSSSSSTLLPPSSSTRGNGVRAKRRKGKRASS
jgi:hypothetical protein